jgi:hypothetical protein
MRRRREEDRGLFVGDGLTFPMASIARSKNNSTPPTRKKPPDGHPCQNPRIDRITYASPLMIGRVWNRYLPPEQKATPISVRGHG